MQPNFPLFPEQASTIAKHVDALYLFLVLITTFFSLLVGLLIVFFAVKYRKTPNRTSEQIHGSMLLEVVWTAIPLAISMVIFVPEQVLVFFLRITHRARRGDQLCQIVFPYPPLPELTRFPHELEDRVHLSLRCLRSVDGHVPAL